MDELANVSIFEKLSAAELHRLSAVATRRRYGAESVVFFEGDPSDSLYVILSGSVKVHQTSQEGHERIVKILGKGEMFGELAMLDGHPRSATVTALEPTDMLVLAHGDFREFAAAQQDVLWKVLAALCGRLRHTSAGMLELTFREPPYRLLAALAQLVNTHGEARPDGCWINIKLTSKDLASMIGTDRETVQRLLRQFQDDGLVRLEKKNALVVPDVQKLGRALEYASEWS